MPDDIDWSLTTFEGNRRRQHEEFFALPLRAKLQRIEQMGAVAEFFASRRARREAQSRQQFQAGSDIQAGRDVQAGGHR
ncbi:MAG: hypothetical protein IT449_17870 [Phycisphaerales bacterium]|nr:hypothetical protein [Phycisphaerales bacterium]